MSERFCFEVEGIDSNGKLFVFELLSRETEDEARGIAEYYADRWSAEVNLYRVPFSDGSLNWAPDEVIFVCKVAPRRKAA